MKLCRKRKWILLVVIIILAGIALLITPWVRTELAVRKVLNDPTVSLSDDEETRIWRYVEGESWRHRPLFLSISKRRQERLVDAGIARVAQANDVLLLWGIADRWKRGEYPTLPSAMMTAIYMETPRADKILVTAGGGLGDRLDSYIDVDFVMLRSKNSMVILSCCGWLKMKTLYFHRDACLEMLMRDDVGVFCKTALLERIIQAHEASQIPLSRLKKEATERIMRSWSLNLGESEIPPLLLNELLKKELIDSIGQKITASDWFESKQEILEHLSLLDDKVLSELVRKVLSLLKTPYGTKSEHFPASGNRGE